MDSAARIRTVFRLRRPRRLLFGIAIASGLIASPTVANAATRAKTTTSEHGIRAQSTQPLSSSVCGNVSASSVAAIVGYSVPAATLTTFNQPATKKTNGISGVLTTCTYGVGASTAALAKEVVLEVEVTSKPLTTSEVKQALAKEATASLKIKLTPYSGSGFTGFYFTETDASIHAQGISGLVGGRTVGVTVFTTTLSKSRVASLAKLAERL
jgi:hypothetical protein